MSFLLLFFPKTSINVFQTWERRTREEFVAAAEKYKNARTRKDATNLLKANGVRWSELLRLPYWDPTRFVVIDVMHNLFLNVVEFHIREVLQLEAAPEQLPAASPDEMVVARKIWADGNATAAQLGKLKVPALIGLCAENNASLPEPERKNGLKKKEIIAALTVCSIVFAF